MTVYVTPAQRDLARLDLELAERLGEQPDPAMVAIAGAELEPSAAPEQPPTEDQVSEEYRRALAETKMPRVEVTAGTGWAVDVSHGPASELWVHVAGLPGLNLEATRKLTEALAHQIADLVPSEREPSETVPGAQTLRRKQERLRATAMEGSGPLVDDRETDDAPATGGTPPREVQDFR